MQPTTEESCAKSGSYTEAIDALDEESTDVSDEKGTDSSDRGDLLK